MNSGELTITAGMLSSFLLELIKFLVRKYYKKDMTYDFPAWFYGVSLPVMNALMPFAMVGLGLPVTDPVLSMSVLGVVRYVILVLIGAGISIFTNTNVNKPVKEYLRS